MVAGKHGKETKKQTEEKLI